MRLPDFDQVNGPVLMLNMLKFRDKAHYMETYIPAFNQVVSQLGIEGVKVMLMSEVVSNIVASEQDDWDAILLVEYPTAQAFKTIAESEAYHTIAGPQREAALTDLKLFMTQKTAL
ncbi:hypothetical protein QNI16_19100 [Cytophagaceae bacterium YF14B1]|uniref:DUF1330 domain-containing protein n=1 Tax=Xanthocytophaga flava TaxID=3048013 RepID=A0AAE3QPQ2_9BACT|nr:hypothetical protein [Xanthocytophaga flavus]MDJ1482616.1 hypothetical protein [Xanthocytophaga flavus]